MLPKLLCAIIFITGLMATSPLNAQLDSATVERKENKNKISGTSHKMNIVKLNLTAIALKNYSVQYERILNRKFSVAVAVRTMPESTLPFQSQILKIVGDEDPDVKKVIETFQLSNFAITPEIRFYASRKGYGRGFYLAPFFRHANFKTNQLVFTYTNSANVESSINLTGKLSANTGGLLLGAQWPLGKSIVLDWYILGPHYGSGNGLFTGVSSQPLSQEEQDDLRTELENFDIPLTNKTVNVNANGASLQLNGPWGGIRAGLSLGIKF